MKILNKTYWKDIMRKEDKILLSVKICCIIILIIMITFILK